MCICTITCIGYMCEIYIIIGVNYCKAACTYDDNDITLVWFGILKVYNSLYNIYIYIYIYR